MRDLYQLPAASRASSALPSRHSRLVAASSLIAAGVGAGGLSCLLLFRAVLVPGLLALLLLVCCLTLVVGVLAVSLVLVAADDFLVLARGDVASGTVTAAAADGKTLRR